MIYFDATFIAKLYLRENESDAIREMVRKTKKTIVSSILGKMETEATLHRKLREREITATHMKFLHQQFQEDAEEGRVKWIPIAQPIIDLVKSSYLELAPDVFLRTGDAIHLATAADFGLKEIYSNDRHLLAAAAIFKLKGINPLAK
jgi:predicted nucleic acid-binding protein